MEEEPSASSSLCAVGGAWNRQGDLEARSHTWQFCVPCQEGCTEQGKCVLSVQDMDTAQQMHQWDLVLRVPSSQRVAAAGLLLSLCPSTSYLTVPCC
jgi:hypothetical protein